MTGEEEDSSAPFPDADNSVSLNTSDNIYTRPFDIFQLLIIV